MIRVSFRSATGHAVTIEGDYLKPLIEELASAEEVFNAQSACGLCKSEAINFRVRAVDKGKYYELLCRDCGATFAFGQHKKDGSLYPKTAEGWRKYVPRIVDAGPIQEPEWLPNQRPTDKQHF